MISRYWLQIKNTTDSERKLTILRHGNKKWCISENVNLIFLLMLSSKYCWDPVKTKIPNSELSTLEYWLVCLDTSFQNFLQQNKYILVLFYKIVYKTIIILFTVYSVKHIYFMWNQSHLFKNKNIQECHLGRLFKQKESKGSKSTLDDKIYPSYKYFAILSREGVSMELS